MARIIAESSAVRIAESAQIENRMSETLQYDEVARLLAALATERGAAEFHGMVCGALCVFEPEQVNGRALLETTDPAQALQRSASNDDGLKAVVEAGLQALQDVENGFTPLLPADDAELALRVQALVSWCEGFLFGLASRKGVNLEACSEELQEIVHDFAEFTKAGFEAGDDQEMEEAAYAELVEYIRVGVQLVFIEFKTHGTESDKPTLH